MTPDWQQMFALSVSPIELIVRGSVMYWFLFLVFRTILQRDLGAIGVADVLLLVLIADAAQNAMSADYKSISDGLILISTIIGWNIALDRAAYKWPALRALVHTPEICLIRNGKVLHRNLRREYMTEDELRAKLREQGVTDYAEVRAAYMESDGMISVIKRSGDSAPQGAPRKPLSAGEK